MHHDTNNFLSVERCWVRGHSSFNLFKDVSGKYSLILTLSSQGHRALFTGTQGSVHRDTGLGSQPSSALHSSAAAAPGQGVGGTGHGTVRQELLHLKLL